MTLRSTVCPNCSAPVQVDNETAGTVCSYCGSMFPAESPKSISQAVPSVPSNAIENLNNLGAVALKSLNFQEARSHFNRVLEMDLVNVNAWFGKGCCAWGIWMTTDQMQAQKESLICFEKAIECSTDPESTMFDIIDILGPGRAKVGATANISAFVDKYPENSATWLYKIDFSFAFIEYFEKAILYSRNKSRVNKEVSDRLLKRLKEWSESKSYKDRVEDAKREKPPYREISMKMIEREKPYVRKMIDLLIRIAPESITQEERQKVLNKLSML